MARYIVLKHYLLPLLVQKLAIECDANFFIAFGS